MRQTNPCSAEAGEGRDITREHHDRHFREGANGTRGENVPYVIYT